MKLDHKFIQDMHEDWERHGKDIIRYVRIHHPVDYIKAMAYISLKIEEDKDNA